MKLIATSFLKTAIPFGLFLGFVMWLAQNSVTEAAIWALGSGALFGAVVAWEKARLTREFAGQYTSDTGKKLLCEAQSNHLQEGSLFFTPVSVGYLRLTDRDIQFTPRRSQPEARRVKVALADITEVKPYRAMGIYSNGVHVRTAHGEERFLVDIGANRTWVDAILRAKSACAAA